MLKSFPGYLNNLTKQHFNDLSVNRLDTYGFNFPSNTQDLVKSRGKSLGQNVFWFIKTQTLENNNWNVVYSPRYHGVSLFLTVSLQLVPGKRNMSHLFLSYVIKYS